MCVCVCTCWRSAGGSGAGRRRSAWALFLSRSYAHVLSSAVSRARTPTNDEVLSTLCFRVPLHIPINSPFCIFIQFPVLTRCDDGDSGNHSTATTPKT